MNEIWENIGGYDGLYQVSNYGNVRSFKRYSNGKILSSKTDKDGYKEIGIRNKDGSRNFKRIHRLVAMEFLPNPDNYMFINHKDNDPSNNIVSNLEWCSVEYNNKYRFTNGNACHKGERHPQATLTNEQVISIYNLGKSGIYTEIAISKMFNTTRSVVNKIRLGHTWTHITNTL